MSAYCDVTSCGMVGVYIVQRSSNIQKSE